MIKSVIWSSLIDYPDHVCTTMFTGVCNFDCEFCYNKGLLKEKEINFEEEILNLLYENEFKIGIHTNGYTPEILEKIIDKIDFIGMDIKNDLDNYNEITQKQIDISKIKKSIEMIIKSGVKYEFRTTVYPKYVNTENILKIAEYLKSVGSKKYVLQNYFDYNKTVIPYAAEKLREMQKGCNEYIPTIVRGII